MQAKYSTHTTRRPLRQKKSLLDQKWLTYLLTFILLLLVGVFVVSVYYQSWIIQKAKWLVQRAKWLLGIEEPPPPRPRPGGVVGKWAHQITFNFFAPDYYFRLDFK